MFFKITSRQVPINQCLTLVGQRHAKFALQFEFKIRHFRLRHQAANKLREPIPPNNPSIGCNSSTNLKMGAAGNVPLILARFHRRILRYDATSATRRVEKNAREVAHYLECDEIIVLLYVKSTVRNR